MTIENVFLNLSDAEFEKAEKWYMHLRIPEQEKILQTFKVLNNTEFCLSGVGVGEDGTLSVHSGYAVRTPLAFIVAGTSIDTDTYTDIDLFALAQDTLYDREAISNYRTAPRTQFQLTLEDLPSGVYIVNYQEKEDFKYALTPKKSVEMGLGAIVTISLLNELSGFEKKRPRKKEDLIEPPGHFGAEDIIEYNHSIGAKFLVLSREYKL